MVGKAPSVGTKVTLGDKAPVTQEGAGDVSGSLAAESAQNGGEFSNNRNVNESGGSDTGAKAPGTSSSSTSTSGGAAPGAAPTYVNNQYTRDSGGPHGKDITEDPELIGRPAKFNVEPGSKEDPGRLAEQDLRLKQTRGAPGTGERQDGAGDQQPFAALDKETSAKENLVRRSKPFRQGNCIFGSMSSLMSYNISNISEIESRKKSMKDLKAQGPEEAKC